MIGKVLTGSRGAAAAEHPLASQAACRAMEDGGNAFDAAAAASFVLAVTQPHLNGLGGDFFGLFYQAGSGRVLCLNSSGWAPSCMSVESMMESGYESVPRFGTSSVVVPGYVKGVYEMQNKYGVLDFSASIDEAARLAEQGFSVGDGLAGSFNAMRDELPQGAVKTLAGEGSRMAPGSVLKQPRLAKTLREIALEGPDAFYLGGPALAIRRELSKGGEAVTEEDLAAFEPEWCDPLVMKYQGTEVFEVPPNSMGATSLLMLKLLRESGVESFGPRSADRIRVTVEAAKSAYAARDRSLADPRFRPFVLEEFLRSVPDATPNRKIEKGDTTYFAVADGEGNLLSCIQSIFYNFGSRVFLEDCGFFLNNRRSGFKLEGPNRVEPRKRPLHTLSSLMLLKDGRPRFAAGCSGGEYRPQQHAILVTNLLDYSMDLEQAIDFPRFLWDGSETVTVEEGFSGLEKLTMKHDLVRYPGRTGVAQAIEVTDGDRKAVCDVRGEGFPAVY